MSSLPDQETTVSSKFQLNSLAVFSKKKPVPTNLGVGKNGALVFKEQCLNKKKFPMESELTLGTAQLESSSAEKEPGAPGGY